MDVLHVFPMFSFKKVYHTKSHAEIVILRIVDYVEDDFLNICVDDLLQECSNFIRTNITFISIGIRASISSFIHV